MRCKNCGTENDDNRYICENCGSPLYDEDDFSETPSASQGNPINNQEALDLGYTPEPDNDNQKGSPAEKKSVIVIAILAVVLIAIIASVVVVAQTREKNNETTTSSTTASTTASTTKHTTTTTQKETTEITAEPTTIQTTTNEYSIKLVSKGGGTVEGSGTYRDGDNVTIKAIPDAGYAFDGWYSNGVKLSTAQSYSFTATENTSISAVFYQQTTAATEPSTDIPEENDGGMD